MQRVWEGVARVPKVLGGVGLWCRPCVPKAEAATRQVTTRLLIIQSSLTCKHRHTPSAQFELHADATDHQKIIDELLGRKKVASGRRRKKKPVSPSKRRAEPDGEWEPGSDYEAEMGQEEEDDTWREACREECSWPGCERRDNVAKQCSECEEKFVHPVCFAEFAARRIDAGGSNVNQNTYCWTCCWKRYPEAAKAELSAAEEELEAKRKAEEAADAEDTAD